MVLFLAAEAATPTLAAEMTFRLVQLDPTCKENCRMSVSASGEIAEHTPRAILEFFRSYDGGIKTRAIFALNSNGGNVYGAIYLGRMLRKWGFTVIVAQTKETESGHADLMGGQCLGSCVYVLMGGVKRVLPKKSRVGITRLYRATPHIDGDGHPTNHDDDGSMRRFIAGYAEEMGVSPELIDIGEKASDHKALFLSPGEAARLRLAEPLADPL